MSYSEVNNKNRNAKRLKGFKHMLHQVKRYIGPPAPELPVFTAIGEDSFGRQSEVGAELSSYSKIINSNSLLTVADLNGNIIFANEEFCRISKYTSEELLGKPHSIVSHPDTPKEMFREMQKAIGEGKTWRGELKNRAKDGSDYWVNATIAPVMDENNKPVKYLIVRINITHQKQMEEELRDAKEKIDIELFQNVNYAKYVHNAFLTTIEEIKTAFPGSFLIYKAQKIISGDFYFVNKKDNTSLIVLGDSTGHGVSASYISVLVLNILNRILKEGAEHPTKILHTMHNEIHHITHLNKDNILTETADTLVCSIDHNTRELRYCSARIKGVIIRRDEIIEMKKDKCSIGELSDKPFHLTEHKLQLEKGDIMYLFSDGVTDQMGGLKDKKFKYAPLLNTLRENYRLPMAVQKKNITETLNSWKGINDLTDDVTLLALKID